VAGWNYQWLAQVGFARESWTAPLDMRRVRPAEDANAVAVAQIARLLPRLPGDGAVPLFVFAAGYDAVAWQQGLAGRRAARTPPSGHQAGRLTPPRPADLPARKVTGLSRR
jgi:hypothetical protein